MMTIRDFIDPGDRAALLGCIVALQEYERQFDPELPEGAAMAAGYFDFLIRQIREFKGRIFMAVQGAEIAGFVCVLTAVPPSEPDDPRTDYAYVSALFVHPQYRGQGLGRKLMQEAERAARMSGAGALRIGVLARNQGARRLYESLGFEDYHVQLRKAL